MATSQTQTAEPAVAATGSLLDDFNFENEQEFFGIKSDTVVEKQKEVIKEVKNPEEEETDEITNLEEETKGKGKPTPAKAKPEAAKPKTAGQPDAEDEEEEPVFFEQGPKSKETAKEKGTEGGEEDVVEDEPEEDKEKDDKFFSTLASEMKEKGIFANIEIKDGEEIDEDKFFELQGKEIESRVDEALEAFMEELDQDGKDFLQFKKNGGKTEDFLATYIVNTQLGITDFDSNDPVQVNKVLTHYLTAVEELDAEELKDRLDFLKEGGKEKAYASKYFKAMEKAGEDERKRLTEQAEKVAATKQKNTDKFNDEIGKVLSKTEAVGDFPITKADQKELVSYITKPTVKVAKDKYVPAFQPELSKILRGETEEDKQKLILLAKLVKTNFDVSGLGVKKKTEVIKTVKSKLADAKAGVKTNTSGSYSKKSLSDFFPDKSKQ